MKAKDLRWRAEAFVKDYNLPQEVVEPLYNMLYNYTTGAAHSEWLACKEVAEKWQTRWEEQQNFVSANAARVVALQIGARQEAEPHEDYEEE